MSGRTTNGFLLPSCPICPADKPHAVIENPGRAGGLLCETCGFVFDGDPAEYRHPRNAKRRSLWAEETRSRPTDELEET